MRAMRSRPLPFLVLIIALPLAASRGDSEMEPQAPEQLEGSELDNSLPRALRDIDEHPRRADAADTIETRPLTTSAGSCT